MQKNNSLIINAEKTEWLGVNVSNQDELLHQGRPIQRKSEIRLLGVMISEDGSSASHQFNRFNE